MFRVSNLLLAAALLAGTATPTTYTRESLKALPGVQVAVEFEGSGLSGLSQQAIQTDIELALRLAGIKVLTEHHAAMPQLIAHIQGIALLDGRVVFDFKLIVQQYTRLEPAERGTARVTTWSAGGLGIEYDLSLLRQGLIKDSVNVFINDWLSVNPR